MNQIESYQTPDLRDIGVELSRAIRRDHEHRLRRRALARSTMLAIAGTAALSGTALATGQLTGAIDLGGGHSAVPVQSTPAPIDPRLPYRYELIGTHHHNGEGDGTIYIESSRPLTQLTQDQLAATRHACGSQTTTVNGATVWVFNGSCAPAQP
ncbi:MAG TPA: hypothetical protein VMU55_04565 [Solirubrobacteraceae bacterium]|nr:hypothetical protein [Solirubrobacteraceae bacterium]